MRPKRNICCENTAKSTLESDKKTEKTIAMQKFKKKLKENKEKHEKAKENRGQTLKMKRTYSADLDKKIKAQKRDQQRRLRDKQKKQKKA